MITGAVIILLVVCLLLLVIRRNLMRALAFGSVVSVGWLSSEVGKRLVERIRPPDGAMHALISEHGTDSFPSGHTAFAVALVWAADLEQPPRSRFATPRSGAQPESVDSDPIHPPAP